MLIFIMTILWVFNSRVSIRPESYYYFFAGIYGAGFGFFLGLFSFWMMVGKATSETKTLGTALAITSIVSAAVIVWVYAIAVAGINELDHPIWASVGLGLTVIALIVWAIKHQLNYRRPTS